jgi:hypothetical protein
MKRNSILSLLFCAVFLWAALPAAAQERVIDGNEYTSLYRAALKLLSGKAYRSTRTYGGQYTEEVPRVVFTDIDEFAPPDRKRNLFVSTSEKGTQKTERITIGDMKYTRKDEGPWTVVREAPGNGTGRGVGEGSGSGSGNGMSKSESTVEFKFIGNEKIGGEDAKLYQRKDVLKYTGVDGKKIENVTTRREWYNKDGLFLKTEMRSIGGSGKTYYHSVVTYEYGPQIKIEAPVVEPAKGS